MVRCSNLGRDKRVFSSWNGLDPSGPTAVLIRGQKDRI